MQNSTNPLTKKLRVVAAALMLSGTGLITILNQEGYTSKATIPTKNDRPTVGFGSTFNEDGSPVKIGDTITPQRALLKAAAHLNKAETLFRASIPNVPLYQQEYDVYMDFVYQFGINTWNKSGMKKNLLAGDYKAACDSLLKYKYSGGYDCSTKGNTRCRGVWLRQLKRHETCLKAAV